MVTVFEVFVRLPLKDAPKWLSHIELTREGDEIVLNLVKTNELSYGEARLSTVDFNNMADVLLTAR